MTKSTGVDNTTLVCALSADTEKSAVIFAQDMKIRRSHVSYNAALFTTRRITHHVSSVRPSVRPSVPCL